VKTDGVNGIGSWLSKAFSRHVLATASKPEEGKFGFLSLRTSVVQGLQSLGVSAEGSVLNMLGMSLMMDTHAAYSMAATMTELLDAVMRLD
jgi:hypothetical protein